MEEHMSDDFNVYDDYDDDDFEEIEKPLLTDMELLRLSHVEISTSKGLADQGFPNVMRRLASFNFVVQVDKGYKLTNEGKLYLDKYRKKLETI